MTVQEIARQFHKDKRSLYATRPAKPTVMKPVITPQGVGSIELANPPVLDHVSLPSGEIVTLQELIDSYVTLQATRAKAKARVDKHRSKTS